MAVAFTGFSAAAEAQENQVRFEARSDVKMSIETGRGTSLVRVQQMAKAFGAPLRKLKECYSKLVEKKPGLEGSLKINVLHPSKGKPRVSIASDTPDRALKRCVDSAFKGLTFPSIERPASAVLTLDFNNSVAKHVPTVEQRQEEAARVDLTQDGSGKWSGRYATGTGEVSFVVSGPRKDAVLAAHKTMLSAVPRLLDCRRRASKLESPAGDLHFNLVLRRKGKGKVKALKGTVASKWALPCSTGAIRRAQHERALGRTRVVVTFGP